MVMSLIFKLTHLFLVFLQMEMLRVFQLLTEKISCDMSSIPSAGVMFGMVNEGTPTSISFFLRVFGTTVGIQSVQVQGTSGQWKSLTRAYQNNWQWNGQGDIGEPFLVRATSILGDTLTLPTSISSASFSPNAKFFFGGQFPSPASGYGGSVSTSCLWPGPPADIFTNSLGGDSTLFWQDSSYTTTAPIYGNNANCPSGSCITVGPTGSNTGLQISYSAGVGSPSSYWTSFQFDVMSSSPETFLVYWTTVNSVTSTKVSFSATPTWTSHTIFMSTFFPGTTGNLHDLQFQFLANTTQPIYFDNIRLVGPLVSIVNRIASPSLAGPPPVGFLGYTGPAPCCFLNVNATPINSTNSTSSPASTNAPTQKSASSPIRSSLFFVLIAVLSAVLLF